MSGEKCFMCKNSATKGPIANLADAAQCTCGSYYHQSCYQRQTKSSAGLLKCCLEKQAALQAAQPLDRAFLIKELQALRGNLQTDISKNSDELGARIDLLGSKLEKRIGKIEDIVNVHDKKIQDNENNVKKHDTDIADLEEKFLCLEQNIGKWKQDSEDFISAEVYDRCRRDRNVIVYNIAEHALPADDIKVLLQNYPTAPFNENDVRSTRLGEKKENLVRPLKLVFNNKDFAHWLFANSKNGIDKNIKCVPDRTALQRKKFSEIIKELNTRKENGEKNLQLKFVNGTPQITLKKNSLPKNLRNTEQSNSQSH